MDTKLGNRLGVRNKMTTGRVLAGALMGLTLVGGSLAAGAAGRTAPPFQIGGGSQWPGVNGDTDETGFSNLAQITQANVARLGLAWSRDLPGEASLEASPIAVGGTLYFTGS